MRTMVIVTPLLAVGMMLAGDSRLPYDIEDGQRLFLANCAACHGPDGNSVQGIDLVHGKLRRATSDDEMTKIIRNGIPGTAMPSSKDFSKYEASVIVSYLRWLASTESNGLVLGDSDAGKALFEGKAGCLGCHRVRDRGSRVGPDLTSIGALRRAVELKKALLDPNAEVLPQNRFVRAVTRNGDTVTGRLLNHDTFTVQLIDSQDALRSFVKSDLREFAFVDKSAMPSYRNKLNHTELADIVAYLVSLKGVEKP